MYLRVAYLVNDYPKVSHSFIRREILALERQGIAVQRIALRGWDNELVDEEDRLERKRTRYVLQDGLLALLWALVRTLLTSPGCFVSALFLALRMGRLTDRGMPYHMAYLAEACRILPWLNTFGATHLHAHFATNSTEVAMLAHVLGGQSYSFTVHGTGEFDRFENLGIDVKLRKAAFVVAVCYSGRSQIYRRTDHAQWPKVKVVHCGVEPGFYNVAPTQLRTEPSLVCVGRLSKEKGQLLLIEAIHRLAGKGLECKLVLAGAGEMRGEVEALIAQYGLSDRIRVTGWISSGQVREEILAARGLILPSFSEGLPVVIMEAMALRRPVLATYVGGIPELVLPGITGWLFPAGNVNVLAAAIEDFLSSSTVALQSMGEAAHLRVVERHSIDTEAAKLAELFRGAAGG